MSAYNGSARDSIDEGLSFFKVFVRRYYFILLGNYYINQLFLIRKVETRIIALSCYSTIHIGSLRGLETALKLGVIKIINKFRGLPSTLQNIIGEYQSRFEGIGKLNDTRVHLTIDTAIKPVACKHRSIPFHLRDKVESEISRLASAGVIEPINERTGWVSPHRMVVFVYALI